MLIWVDVDRGRLDSTVRDTGASSPVTTRRADHGALADLESARISRGNVEWSAGENAAAQRDVRMLEVVLRDPDVRGATKEANRRFDLVRRAEEFMWAHVEDPIDPAGIANALNCSVRKLLYYFKRTYGVGPIRYFKLQRLIAVREVLLADRSRRTIADIAADYGFWHMGHFGSAYRRLFDATPSQTRNVVLPQGESASACRAAHTGDCVRKFA